VTRPGKLAVACTAFVAAFALTACGSDDGGSSTAPKTIQVTFDGETVTPNGDRVEVKTGQEIKLVITADKPGEIHVHSTPEDEFAYDAGKSTKTITIDQPGVVDVESHTLDKVIVQLEVK